MLKFDVINNELIRLHSDYNTIMNRLFEGDFVGDDDGETMEFLCKQVVAIQTNITNLYCILEREQNQETVTYTSAEVTD